MTTETQIKPNIKQTVPFFSVSNIEASVKFYVDGLGFEMKNKWVKDDKLCWCFLERDNAGLMLQEFATEGPNSWVPEGKVGEGVTIVFFCDDALAIYHEAISHGLEASKPFVGNGMWVTNLKDPDGFKVCFQSDTDVPEGTDYSERRP